MKGGRCEHLSSAYPAGAPVDRRRRRQPARWLAGPRRAAQSARQRLRGGRPSRQSALFRDRRHQGSPRPRRPRNAARRAGGDGAGTGRPRNHRCSERQGRRGGDHHQRRGPRSLAEAARTAARAHGLRVPGPNGTGLIVPRRQGQRQLHTADARVRQSRADLPIGRDRSRDARMGGAAPPGLSRRSPRSATLSTSTSATCSIISPSIATLARS
jgi:hypothetical protein